MAQSISFNGVVYTIPDVGDDSWGQNLTDYFVAISSGALQKTGGTFSLTANVNFGANFGLLSKYFTSISSNSATSGVVRLANLESVSWRNAANSGNLPLAVDASDRLTFNGNPISSSSGIIPVSAGGTGLSSGTSGGILGFTASGVIASSVALTANQLVIGGGSGATPSPLAAGTQYQVLVMGAANPGYGAVSLDQSVAVSGTLPAARGGTGVSNNSTLTWSANSLAFVTSGATSVTLPTSGTLSTLAGSETLTNKTLTTPVINSPTGLVKADVGLGNVDNTSDATKNAAAVTLTNKTISGLSNTLSDISLTASVSGILPVSNGGTGASTLTLNNVVLGNGTSAVQFVAPGTSGNILTSNGTTWQSSTPVTGVSVVGTIDSQTKSANGAVISGSNIYMQNADATSVGLVSTSSQTFAGNKTFSGVILGPTGSATAPSHSFSGDPNTGIYSGGADVLTFATGGAERGYFDSTGKLLVGTINRPTGRHEVWNESTSDEVLYLKNNSSSTSSDVRPDLVLVKGSTTQTTSQKFVEFYTNGGSTLQGQITCNSGATVVLSNASDRRLKTDIQPMECVLELFERVNPVTFKWKSSGESHQGFIAQELNEVIPSMVIKSDSGEGEVDPSKPWLIAEANFIPFLVRAVKELKMQVDALTSQIEGIKK